MFRMLIVFSMKFTPIDGQHTPDWTYLDELTQCLNIVLIPTAFHVLDHQAGLAYLCVAYHADLNHHAGILLCLLPLPILAVLAPLRS